MAKLLYSAICSLDGFVADSAGNFRWAAPSEEVHAFVNEQERSAGTYLYGRRMYETMVAWETMDTSAQSEAMRDYAEIWRAAEKVVYSRTLQEVESERTRLEREFDPGAVAAQKAAAERDITIGGPELGRRGICRRPGRRDSPDPRPGAGRRRHRGASRRCATRPRGA